MADNDRIILATTFSIDEVKTLVVLLAMLDRGGDVSEIFRNGAINSLRQKFLKMKAKAER